MSEKIISIPLSMYHRELIDLHEKHAEETREAYNRGWGDAVDNIASGLRKEMDGVIGKCTENAELEEIVKFIRNHIKENDK